VSAADLAGWTPRPRPDGRALDGRFVRLERLAAERHAGDLGRDLSGPERAPLYDWLFEPPPATPAAVEAWARGVESSADPFFYAVVDRESGRAVGRMALMRIDPGHGVIEVGNILYGPGLARRPGGTEAIALLARHVFDDLGYRRFEWKCNDRNAPSKRAALRYGFAYEGLFRQHMVVKGRNRDTAWFAMTDGDWQWLAPAYARWLAPENFDAGGGQRAPLGALTARELPAGPRRRLRRATEADLGRLIALQRAAFAANRDILGVEPLPLLWDYRAKLRQSEVWITHAADAALVLDLEPGALDLASIAVHPAAQGKGLGRALLRAAEERALALGRAAVTLVTGEALTRNVALYRRAGYEAVRTEQLPDRRIVHFRKMIGGTAHGEEARR
jgi:RimJ/RimL family protein N-acetyltransferase